MSAERYRWTYDTDRHRYVIWRGGSVYQVIVPTRRNPAHSQTYVERCCAILNGAKDG